MGVDTVQVTHRPSFLKQQNKPHKHGRHRSKGAIDKASKGRVPVKVISKKARKELNKQDRRHKAVQLRNNKRDEVFMKKRALGSGTSPPFLVAIVPLCYDIDPYGIVAFLKQADPEAMVDKSGEGVIHINIPRFKQRFAVVVPACGDVYGILDALKVADTVLFVLSATTSRGYDSGGEIILSACSAQGLPSTIVTLAYLESIPPKKRHDVKQQVQKAIYNWFPDTKIVSLEKSSDGLNMLRRIGNKKQNKVSYRDRRPHLLAENIVYEPDEEGPLGVLKVSGYVRGLTLSVNSLVHIPGWGDYQMSQMTAPDDPYPLTKSSRKDDTNEEYYEEDLLAKADPNLQESLISENIPDPMEGEQTWPSEEEIKEAEEQQKGKEHVKRIPKGMSEYQAAWIPDSDEDEISDSDNESDENNFMDAKSESDSEAENPEDEEEYDTVTVSEFAGDAQKYDEKMDLTEEEEALKLIKDARSHVIFPDEIDTPKETPARVRFQKYRGLQSFRTSPWDPKENLPLDYARIFQFENFDRTRKRVFHDSQEQDGALPGWYVTLHIINVPKDLVELRNQSQPLIVYGMLPHEQKLSVVNILLRRPHISLGEQKPIKSKEPLVLHCGYRRFKFCPIFSQHRNGAKHKYERYFQPGTTVVATVFAPIIFPPCGTLVFKESKDGSQDLVAVGSVLSVNPDRIVAKRVVLSGHPIRINKKSSVIRFMFFNKEDIEWFKPVELKTKEGRRGNIKEALGTHGHMKCVFNGQLRSQDTVLMCLYKRVFPKWTYEPYLERPPSLYDNLKLDEMETDT